MSKRSNPPGGGIGANQSSSIGNAPTAGSAPTATHVHASSIGLPAASVGLSRLQGQLTELAQQVTPFTRRDVTCRRVDDDDEARMTLEQDGMYAPIRRARAQARLRVVFEEQHIELRLYAKPAGKGPESMDVYNLVSVPLTCQSDAHSRKGTSSALDDIDTGANEWQQVVRAMGWEPDHAVVRRGHRFVIRDAVACRVEAHLFRLFRLDDRDDSSQKPTLQCIADTHILQITATLPLLVKTAASAPSNTGDTYTALDASKLSERAQSEVKALQEVLRGLVEMGKEEE